MAAVRLFSVDYEVFGRVQGVFFRKYTHKTAEQLGLVGWVKNTDHGTVVGTVQGPEAKVMRMKEWLSKEGSPHSKISKCSFNNQRYIDKLEYSSFKLDWF